MPYQKSENRKGLANVEGKEFFLQYTASVTASSNPKNYYFTTAPSTKQTVLSEVNLFPSSTATAVFRIYEGITPQSASGTGSLVTSYCSDRNLWNASSLVRQNGSISQSSGAGGTLIWESFFKADIQPNVTLKLKPSTVYNFSVEVPGQEQDTWTIGLHWLEL